MTDKEFLKALKTRIYYGMIRDGENKEWIADEVEVIDNNFYITFIDCSEEVKNEEYL